jgi:inner membrane protein
MDNVTHAALGLSAGLVVARRGGSLSAAALASLLASEAPDLDVFVRQPDDILASFRWHRHFAHSFAFVPIWGFLAAWLTSKLYQWRRKISAPWTELFIPGMVGTLTHLLCDNCTSYGTMLFWPFNSTRYAWDCLPIVDLFATLPLLTLTFFALRGEKSRKLAAIGLSWFILYASFGVYQNYRAETHLRAWLTNQKIAPGRLTVKPTISNLWLWRATWEQDGRWHVGVLHLKPWGDIKLLLGETIAVWTPETPGTPIAGSFGAQSLADFSAFTRGWNSYRPNPEGIIIGDIRYTLLPTSAQAVWALQSDANGTPPSTRLVMHREIQSDGLKKFWLLLQGENSGFVTIP